MTTKEEVIEKINALTDWYPKSYAGGLFGIYIQAMGLSRGAKEIPYAMSYGLVYQNRNRPDHWDWFWSVDEMKQKRAMLLDAAVNDVHFTDSYFAEYRKRYDEYVACFEQCAAVSMEKLFKREMFGDFRKLYDCAVAQAAYGYVVDSLLTNGTEDWLQTLITEELGEKATPETVTRLTATVFNTFVSEYDIAMLELAVLVSVGAAEEKIAARAGEVEKRFFWVKTNYLDYTRVTAEEILDEARRRAKTVKNLRELIAEKKNAPEHNRKVKDRLFAELKVSPKLKSIIHLSETFAYIQDKRKECVLRNNTLFYETLETLAEQNHFDRKLVFYITPEEFFAFLEKGTAPDWTLVSRRFRDGCLVLYFNGTSALLYKDEIDSSIKTEHLFPDLGQVRELRGSTAFKGKVSGTVRVLRNSGEIARFRRGEILVANQTTPEFVPAMKKAAAIITNQGGITSHASIIARELMVPCIVGVKNATEVLKDGDNVEVNANIGVVKKM